jgi:transcriptional regulator with XRE-family HTH domain
MRTQSPHQSITQFSLRLKTARKAANLTQEQLGLAVGLDEFVASSRMNHYEKGRHWPNYDLVSKIAAALNLPSAYFHAKEDDVAQVILGYWRGLPESKIRILSLCNGKEMTEVGTY